MGMTHASLMVEFAVLFVAMPLGYRFSPVRIPALPVPIDQLPGESQVPLRPSHAHP
jgi:hypothetical protein